MPRQTRPSALSMEDLYDLWHAIEHLQGGVIAITWRFDRADQKNPFWTLHAVFRKDGDDIAYAKAECVLHRTESPASAVGSFFTLLHRLDASIALSNFHNATGNVVSA